MNRRFSVILVAATLGIALISLPINVNAANPATAKPLIYKHVQSDVAKCKSSTEWSNRLKDKYYKLSLVPDFKPHWLNGVWGFGWWWNDDGSGGIQIIKSIYDYEDYTHIYIIMDESKE